MNSIHFLKTHRLAGFAALLALLFLSSACSKDSGDTSGDSSTTTGLKISLGGIAEGGSESLEKSALQAETVTQKLDSDMTVEYTLAPTAASLTRSTSTMTDGVKYRVLVYTSGGTYVAYRDYTAGSESATAAIPVDAGDYQVVAYSYNTSDDIADDATATSLSVDTDKDLLYYSTTVTVADGTSNPVGITFTHWFSKVTVAVSTSTLGADINAISGVTLSPTYASASVALLSGETTSASTSSQAVSFSTTGDTILTAATIPVFAATGTASFSVAIGSLTLGSSTTYSSLSTTFTKTLVAGYSYTLRANLKNNFIIGGVRWAKGNLYKTASASGIWSTQQYYSGNYTKGDYWNFGATSPYNNYTYYSTAASWGGASSLETDPCNLALGGKWRLPTQSDQTNLIASTSLWTTKNSVNGRYFKTATAPTLNSDAFLFLPAAGYREASATDIQIPSNQGRYHVSNPTDIGGGQVVLLFGSSACYMGSFSINAGLSIRCVQDL
jgi:hypothetical protein